MTPTGWLGGDHRRTSRHGASEGHRERNRPHAQASAKWHRRSGPWCCWPYPRSAGTPARALDPHLLHQCARAGRHSPRRDLATGPRQRHVLPARRSGVRAALIPVGVVAVLAVLLSGCGSPPAARRATGPHTPQAGRLTDQEYAAAVALARREVTREDASLTSATATVGVGTVPDPNTGHDCVSGRLLHVTLIGTFPHIVTTGHPVESGAADEDFMGACRRADRRCQGWPRLPDLGQDRSRRSGPGGWCWT